MNKVLKKLEQFGIVPVVVLEDAKDAVLLAKALCDGGLACAEATNRIMTLKGKSLYPN